MRSSDTAEEHEETACILCGSMESTFVFKENGYDLLRCPDCGLFFVHPMPSYGQNFTEHRDVELPTAERHYSIEKSFFDQWYSQIRHELLTSDTLLDVGCGCGRLLELIRSDFPDKHISGIELDKKRAEFASEKAGCAIHTRPLEVLDLDQDCDTVIMINVLSHIPNIREFLVFLWEFLPDNARILIKTGECARNVRRIDGGNKWYLPDHVHFLGLETIDYICKTFGFIKVKHERLPYAKLLFDKKSLGQMSGNRGKDLIRKTLIHLPPLRMALSFVFQVLFSRIYTSFIVLQKGPRAGSV